MGIHLKQTNANLRFRSLSHKAIVINDYDISSDEAIEKFNNLLYTTHSGDVLSNAPRCECEYSIGKANLGAICSECGTEVVVTTSETLEPIMWLRVPVGVRGLFNIHAWGVLEDFFTITKVSYLQWFTNTRYVVQRRPVQLVKVEVELQKAGITRGYNSFIDNFDAVIAIFTKCLLNKSGRIAFAAVQAYLDENRDTLIQEYMPILNKGVFVVEESNMGPYFNARDVEALNAVRMVVGIDNVDRNVSQYEKENKIARMLAALSAYFIDVYSNVLSRKEGLCRKQLFGTRFHFSYRGVITSITDTHDYREQHIPWSMGVTIFREHIFNILVNKGYSIPEVSRIHAEGTLRYCPILAGAMEELLTGGDYIGYPTLLQRNPSLWRGSIQLFYITKVKADLSDPTISMSILDTVPFNADFDGDALNGVLLKDKYTVAMLEAFLPHKNAMSLDTPHAFSDNLTLSKPIVYNAMNWLRERESEPDLTKLERMKEFT